MVSKYRGIPTTCDGIKFASMKEARRYGELKLLLRAGRISDLRLQVRYPLEVNGHLVCTYVSDFDYIEGGASVTEDVKGFKTPAYKIKRKLMAAIHGIVIRET